MFCLLICLGETGAAGPGELPLQVFSDLERIELSPKMSLQSLIWPYQRQEEAFPGQKLSWSGLMFYQLPELTRGYPEAAESLLSVPGKSDYTEMSTE